MIQKIRLPLKNILKSRKSNMIKHQMVIWHNYQRAIKHRPQALTLITAVIHTAWNRMTIPMEWMTTALTMLVLMNFFLDFSPVEASWVRWKLPIRGFLYQQFLKVGMIKTKMTVVLNFRGKKYLVIYLHFHL